MRDNQSQNVPFKTICRDQSCILLNLYLEVITITTAYFVEKTPKVIKYQRARFIALNPMEIYKVILIKV